MPEYRTRPPPPPTQYEQPYVPPPYQVSVDTANSIAGKVVDAYRISPFMTGFFILVIIMFAGFGWHLQQWNERSLEISKMFFAQIQDMQNKTLDLAKDCVVPDMSHLRRQPYEVYAPPAQPRYQLPPVEVPAQHQAPGVKK